MKRALNSVSIFILFVLMLFITVLAPADPQKEETPQATPAAQQPVEPPSGEQGPGAQFSQGGKEVGHHYSRGGKQMAQGAAGFGSNLAKGEVDDAGVALGQGSGGFGKQVGVGTARGFKHIGRGFAQVGRKIGSFFAGN